MKILVIEDQPEIRDTLRDMLELNGHQVFAAEDGEQGLRLATEHAPDFIFCDVAMPRLDGYGVLEAVRRLPSVRDTPFVFLTAKVEREDQRVGMTLGADDYITKPFSERDILGAIEARIARQRPLRERADALLDYRRGEIQAPWSHELLTPLNAVLGALELLEAEADTISRADLREMLALIRAGAESQQKLAQKLIRFFELEQRLLSPAPDPAPRVRVDFVIAAGASRAAAETRREADLALDLAPGEVALAEDHLGRAIYEIASNAFYFSPPRSPVSVRGRIVDGAYRVELRDEGPGLTPEQCASFGAFRQFNRGKREQPGLGLGLAIAQATARLAGGSLVLQPVSPGPGLLVTLTLPGVAGDT